MNTNGTNLLAGSVVRTSDQTLWYSCGDWQLSGISDAYPCIPAYILESLFPVDTKINKRIVAFNKSYVKIFGHYGLPLNTHRDVLYTSMEDIIYPISLGRMVFVKKSHILEAKDPKQYRARLLRELEDAEEIYNSLVNLLGVSINDLGISGSVLAIGTPSWRHETDFSIYGRSACGKVFSLIEENRNSGIFSKESIPPYHMPFKYMGKWFDPHFSDVAR